MKLEEAFEIAIKSIEMRQRQYRSGHVEFLNRGDMFEFAKSDHNNWEKLEMAKTILLRQITANNGNQLTLFGVGDEIKD